jgi:hypothetical protein
MKKGEFISKKMAGITGGMMLCLALTLALSPVYGKAVVAAEEELIRSEYSCLRYTTADGLPNLITTSAFQDSKGFLWVGCVQGFARFDGQQFKAFDSKSLAIADFAEHNHQIIAVGLVSSFCIAGNDSAYQVKMVNSNSDIYCWHNSKTLPDGYGVYKIDNRKSLCAITGAGLTMVWEHELLDLTGEANELYWDKPNKRFFIPTEKQGVYIVHEDGTVMNHFEVNTVTNFIPYGNGFCAASHDGLYEYKDSKLNLMFGYPFFNGESADIQLLESAEHDLLVRTVSCLYRYSRGKLELITDKLMSARDLFVDREGNIWVAAGNGLFNFYHLNFKNRALLPEGSMTQSLAFSVTPAFWQTAWFLTAVVAFLMLAGAGIALYIQRRRNRILLEKLRAEKELNELRISSIRLKAIPHFNANVLAAIEYYIANRTKEDAMRLLGIYSDFTFKTLSEVDKAARPLSEELAYVKMYLDLEKIRFLDKFDFRIDVEEDVDRSVQLPNMILHTYCENAVKHGLMPRKSGGLLTIRVTQHERHVCVSVEDNGVGRDYARCNPHLHSTKQGLSILNRQIEIYNRFNREKIRRQVDDLMLNGEPEGTRFTVEVPLDFTYIN